MKNMLSSLCLVIFAAMLAACSSSNGPEAVVEKYASYVQNEQYEKLIDITHFSKELTQEEKEETAQLLREKGAKEFEKLGGLKSVEITGTDVAEDGKTASVHTIVHYGDGSEKKEDMNTILVDGHWMLDSGK